MRAIKLPNLRRDPDAPSLRERFAATKEKYARTLRVHRALNGPLPNPEPAPVPRLALLNYASWLYYERSKVCAELYPQSKGQSDCFVLDGFAADAWHFRPKDHGRAPTMFDASNRAVKVLDMVGVDWRGDANRHIAGASADASMQEVVNDKALPPGWPEADAVLVTALSDLRRLDAACAALLTDDDRKVEDIPGYPETIEARSRVLGVLIRERVHGIHGLKAKAAALVSPDVQGDIDTLSDLASSLAADLLGVHHALIEPRPDRIISAIKACDAAEKRHAELFAACNHLPEQAPEWQAEDEARKAYWRIWQEQVLTTMPQTAQGLAALARFAASFLERQGGSLDDDGPVLLRLMAKSPAL